MKIIILNDYASVQGGAAQVAVASAKGLAEAGHHVTFIYATGSADPLLDHSNITLIYLHQYDLLSNPSRVNAMMTGIWNRSVEKQLNTILDTFQKEDTIVHIHSWVKALSASAVSVIVKRRFPVVLTLHDYFAVCPNGGLYNYQEQSICTLKPMSTNCLASNCDMRSYSQKLWRYMRQLLYTKAGIPNHIKHFIYVSEFSKNILKTYLPEHATFWNISNPIDISKESIADPKSSNTFSFIGRLSAEKGALLFADASNKLNVQARFVGSGDLEVDLKTLNKNAEFTGWCDRKKIVSYIKNSRAVVFPSQLYETQGMVVPEAAALGVPSIVSDTCAASEYIIDGKTGLLFESGNVESLMQKIQLLSNDPDLAKELGRNAYEHYWNNPNNMQKHIAGLIKCYKTILQEYKNNRELK